MSYFLRSRKLYLVTLLVLALALFGPRVGLFIGGEAPTIDTEHSGESQGDLSEGPPVSTPEASLERAAEELTEIGVEEAAAAESTPTATVSNQPEAIEPLPGRFHPDRIIVKFKAGKNESVRTNVRRQESLERVAELRLIRAEVASVRGRSPEETVRALNRRPEVEYAELDHVRHPSNYSDEPYFKSLWGLNNSGQAINGVSGASDVDTNALEASATTLGDPNLVVAVIDTGTDFSHPDLAGRQWVNHGESGGGRETNGVDDDKNGYVDDISGWDFYNKDASVYDSADGDKHGTHVSGTIAANVNGQGVVGMAPKVKVMALKFLGPNGGYTSDAVRAIEYARSMGAKISNNSWGGGGYNQALKDAIGASGSLFVAAAGNSGVDADSSPSYPGAYDSSNILSVAAVDNQGKLATFSNYGSTSVDISAPGVYILSTLPGGSYAWMSGTSMAAPHATGAAALLASLSPGVLGDPTGLKALLMDTGKPAPNTTGKTVSGRMIDARAALGDRSADTGAPSGTVSINAGAAYTITTSVSVAVPAADSGSGVSEVRVSNSGDTFSGPLSMGKTLTYTTPISWDLADSTTGGSGTDGARTVYVQWRDKAGNWSQVRSDTILLDTAAPVAAPPVQRFVVPSQIGITLIPVRLNWSGTDATSGVARYQLQQSTNGGAYAYLTLSSGTATSLTPSLTPGYTYRFRVRTQDRAGNRSTWAYGKGFKVQAHQELSTTLRFTGTWTTAKLKAAYGRTLRYATAPGSQVRFTFSGRNVALVARRSASSGQAAIYFDGNYLTTVDLYSPTVLQRRVVFTQDGLDPSVSHTLEVRVLGTKNPSSTGTRVDIDAFVVLR